MCRSVPNVPRMGYIIRRSNQNAYHNGDTYVECQGKMCLLSKPLTKCEKGLLRCLYLMENTTCDYPDYTQVKTITFNNGDFLKPIL